MFDVDNLTKNNVSVNIQGFWKAFQNNNQDRMRLKNEISQELYDEIIRTWGDTPTLPDPTFEEPIYAEPEPTETEQMQEIMLDLDFRISLLEMGV